MSAIAGILHLDRGATEAEPAERMAAARAWRGPDDEGSYRSPDGRCALAARRLASLDRSAAAGQPMANETHDVWLALDGEVLNHRALRHSLELVGHRFRSNSDSEVVLHAYEQWELGFLAHLQGAFALAIWDDRRDRLVLARDRLGRKPLFVAEHRGRLGFASGLGPLIDELGMPRRLAPAALAQYMSLGVVPAPATLVAGVTKLGPGEMLVADRLGPPRRQRWHTIEPDERRAASVRALPAERHAGNLRTLLECAVADRLLSDMPVGVWMSPAATNGAIAAIINQLTGQPPRALAVLADPDSVAAYEMRQWAQSTGIELTERLVTAQDMVAALPLMTDCLAEPVAHSALATAWFAARLGQETRCSALLADTGADEIFLCHPAYECARRASLWRRLSALLPGRPPVPPRPGGGLPPPGVRPFTDRDGASLLNAALPQAPPPPVVLPAWMREDGLAALGLGDLFLRIGDGIAPGLDAMAQAHGLEARLPLLDDALVNYALAVPGRMRSPSGAPRLLLRKVLADLATPAALSRPRAAPCLPLESWLAGPLAAELEGLRWGLLKPQALRALIADHRATLAHGEALWALLSLAGWCKALGLDELADGEPPQPELAHSRS